MRNDKYIIERKGIRCSVLDGFRIKDNFVKIRDVESILIKDCKYLNKPLVSVLVPTYKRVETLKETLQSCFNQKTDVPFNIIIIDSNSERNDVTEQYIRTIDDNRVKYYKYTRDVSAIDNRNRAFELSDAEYALMIHDDDILYSGFIQTMTGLMLEYQDIDILYPQKDDWYQFEGQECPQERAVGKRHLYRLTTCNFANSNVGFPTGFMIKKSVVMKLGGWDETYSPSSDWVFNVKAIINGVKVYKYNQPMFVYRLGENDTRNIKTRIRFLETNPQVIYSISSCHLVSIIFRSYFIKEYYRWEKQEIIRLIPDLKEYPEEKLLIESLIPQDDSIKKMNRAKVVLRWWNRWLTCLYYINRLF